MNPLTGLNENQMKAVIQTRGPLLIVAGAGAGKTKVITHRTAHLIAKGIRPDQILAVTFTNKAAHEMKERILRLRLEQVQKLTPFSKSPTIGTFHAVCARILRENAKSVGRTRNFTILDEEDSLKTIKLNLQTLEINPKQFQPAKIKSMISRHKSNLLKLEDMEKEAEDYFFPRNIARIWAEYEKNLERQNGLDFDDLIASTVYLFQEKPEVLKKYQEKWHYIMIDEYQDTNYSQYVLTQLLAQKHKNICVVGDTDQSIYSWRGANFENIFKFEKDWPGAKIVVLDENYRSAQKILEAANAVIANNKLRRPKNLFSRLGQGSNLALFGAFSETEEAEFIALKSKELITNGINPSEIAVLYRANFQSRILEELFLIHQLPYQVIGVKFFQRKEVKDIMAYLKAGLNPNDMLSSKRIVNEPPRGIGKTGLFNYFANKRAGQDKIAKIKDFFKLLKEIRVAAEKMPASQTLKFTIKKSGYQNYLQDQTEKGKMRLDNLKELISLSAEYDALKPPLGVIRLIEEAALLSEQDTIKNSQSAVRLMTVHAAKGLEFQNVFISGLEEGLFPYPDYSGTQNEEEERRLFYVALTRAKEKVFLSFAFNRNFFGGRQLNKPSRFLKEIPEELLETTQEKLRNVDYGP